MSSLYPEKPEHSGPRPSGLHLWIIAVVASILACSGLAFAGAVSLNDLANPGLVASSTPELLGPITQAGRKGWECKPERVAAAKHAAAAELPSGGPTP